MYMDNSIFTSFYHQYFFMMSLSFFF